MKLQLNYNSIWILFALSFFITTSPIFAQDDPGIPKPGEILAEFALKVTPENPRLGEEIRFEIEGKVKEGWHFYSIIPQGEDAPPPTSVKIKSYGLDQNGPVYESQPIFEFDPAIGMKLSYHEGGTFYQNFKIAKDFYTGEHDISAKIRYQVCSNRLCMPPKNIDLNLSFPVADGPARSEYLVANRAINETPIKEGNSRREASSESLDNAMAGGVWAFFGLAALMGLASLLTPCVFPMVPITVSFFTHQAEGSRSRLIKLATIFALGIIFTYTGTGLLVTLFMGAGGVISLGANPYLNLIIGTVFILFALSLIGLFEIKLPVQIQGYFDQKSRNVGGVAGVLLMGFTFTLTAFTCTVQFVGTLLIAASQGEWLWPLLGMLVFSSVFALPFFILALAPSLIQKTRGKAGAWLEQSKVILGILELMVSVKFISNADLVWQSNLLSRDTVVALWTLLSLSIVVFLIFKFQNAVKKTWVRGIVVVFFIGMTTFIGSGWNGGSLGNLLNSLLPPPTNGHLAGGDFVGEEEMKELVWYTDIDQALTVAEQENKALFIDFTGYTCVNCRWMEQNMFPKKQVYQKFKNDYILVRLYTDGGDDGEKNQKLQINRFKTLALPFYVVLNNKNEPIRNFAGIFREEKEFVDFLRKPSQEGEVVAAKE